MAPIACKLRSTTSNQKPRDDYRRLTGFRSLGFTTLGFDGDGPESDTESVVDSESEDESDDVSEDDDDEEDDEEDDDEEEEEKEVVKIERFLLLSTAY